MRLKNLLEFDFNSNTPISVKIALNNVVQEYTVNGPSPITVTLDPLPDFNSSHVLEITQSSEEFLYIDRIKLGSMVVTEFMHHNYTCKVVDTKTGDPIGVFINDLGPPDKMIITIPYNFYEIILNRLDLVVF
jgi:hypothetical protein